MYKRLEKNAAEDAEEHWIGWMVGGTSRHSLPCQGFKHVIILSDLQTFEHSGHLSYSLAPTSI